MSEYARLVVSVDSRQVRATDNDLDRLGRTVGRTESATNQLTGAFRRLAGPLAAVISAREIAQASENYTTLTNRLRLVTTNTESLIAAQAAVFDIAQDSRQPLAATAELYQRIAANSQELGLSANEIVSVVDTVNKTLAISGSSAAAASGALVQLGQAFASGQLRGEELNAVLEAAPPLAKAIADGLGVTVGELRKLGADGLLTADAIAQAIIKQGDAVDQLFGRSVKTASQSLTQLGNSLTQAIGEIDNATGSSLAFSNTISSISKLIDSGALTLPIIQSAAIWGRELDNISGDFSATFNIISDLLGDFEDDSKSAASAYVFEFKNIPADLRAAVRVATVEIASLIDNNVNQVQALGAAIAAIPNGLDAVKSAYSGVRQEVEILAQTRQESIDAIFQERDASIQAGEAAKKRFEDERKARQEQRTRTEKEIEDLRKRLQGRNIELGGGTGTGTSKAAQEAAQAAERLQQLYDTTEKGLARQIALFGETTGAAQLRYDLENGELAALAGPRKENLISLQEELDRLQQIEKLKQESQGTEQYTAALRDQVSARRNAIDIEIESIGVGQRRAQTLRDLNQLEFEYARRLEELARAQGTSSALSAEAYQARVDALRAAMLQEIAIVEEGEKKKAVARGDAVSGIRQATEDYIDSANDLSSGFADAAGSAFQGLEDQIVQFVTTGKTSFADFANSVIADLIRIEARKAVAFAIGGSDGKGGLSSLLGMGLNAAASYFGGPAGSAAAGASISGYTGSAYSSWLSSLPKFDKGGFLPANSWGIVGERGPELVRGPANITGREDTAKMMGAPSVNIQQMNFPGITNAQEARQATATAARQIAQAVQNSARYT
ncbi:MAG: phage tail tape measure protein [Ectopseudomonas guguanensis]|uniref:phage tail tape measure protein n=1 Tax=Ectopseudomonas guguanensis TaxID=1198456 RepID=UPI00391D92E6